MIYRVLRDGPDMRQTAPSWTHYVAIAALAVWALAAVGVWVLAGAGVAATIVMALVVATLVLGSVAAPSVPVGEIAVGVGLLLAGVIWMLLWGISALDRGLGWGTADVFG